MSTKEIDVCLFESKWGSEIVSQHISLREADLEETILGYGKCVIEMLDKGEIQKGRLSSIDNRIANERLAFAARLEELNTIRSSVLALEHDGSE